MRNSFVLAACLLAAGCGTGNIKGMENSSSVEPGDSKQDVIAKLGEPGDRQFSGTDEAWQYCRTNFRSSDYRVIWFANGRVTGLNTYTNSDTAGSLCGSHFRQVNWHDAPDRVIEIRER